MPPGPPSRSDMRRAKNAHTATNRRMGTSHDSTVSRKALSNWPENATLCSSRSAARSLSTLVVTKRLLPSMGSVNSPRMSCDVTTTSLTFLSFRYFWKSLYGIGATVCVVTHRLCRSSTPKTANRR